MHAHAPHSPIPFETVAKKLNWKVTPARMRLLEVLQSTPAPITIDELADQMKAIDKATIYRNLVQLHAQGFVREIDLHQSKTYYEWNHSEDHHHIVCIRCEKIQDFTGCNFSRLEKNALRQAKGFSRVLEHSFELFGLCRECDRKKI